MWALPAAALLLAMVGGGQARAQSVQPPPLWHDGDTHGHIQLCGTTPDLTPNDIYQQQQSVGLSIVAPLIWAKYKLDPAIFFAIYGPLVTGSENPSTQGDPGYIQQFGTEASGFNASIFGHATGLGINATAFDPLEPFPAPILEYFRQQPNAITGYAHMFWEPGYGTPSFIGGKAIPYMAPLDVALGLVDFVEAPHVAEAATLDWRNIVYKLWNAGLRVSLAAGTDNSCLNDGIGDVRTYASIVAEPLTFDKWTSAIASGRTTIAEGASLFLDMKVDGFPIGDEVNLTGPGMVTVQGSLLHALAQGVTETGVVKVVMNGSVVGAHPYVVSGSGIDDFSLPILIDKSGWIALDSGTAHTGPSYVIVDRLPISNAADGTYWVDYATDFVISIVSQAALTGPDAQAAFEHILAGQNIFAALAAVDLPLPAGVTTYGASTSACDGPLAIGVTAPPGQPFSITAVHAPPNASGFLVLGLAADALGTPVLGIDLHVDLTILNVIVPVTANEGGYSAFPVSFGSGLQIFGQYVWINTNECGNGSTLSSTNALSITIP